MDQLITENFAIYNQDCVAGMKKLPDNSIDFSCYSPPFNSIYNYSSSDEDMSNARNYEEFLEHYEFAVEQVARVTKPGRMSFVHCFAIPKGMVLIDFGGDIIRIHERHGFKWHGEHVVWKEPLRIAIKTRTRGLMHKVIVQDSTLTRAALHDRCLIFRKTGDNAVPVAHPMGLSKYAGETPFPQGLKEKYQGWEDQKTNKLSHWIWQHYASSVWMDIRGNRVLKYKPARDSEDERHVCPMMLDIPDRAMQLYTNPRDIVLTPFLGVGSEVYSAVTNNRRGIGFDTKPGYFRQACKNLTPPYEHAEDEGELGLTYENEEWPIEEIDIEHDNGKATLFPVNGHPPAAKKPADLFS